MSFAEDSMAHTATVKALTGVSSGCARVSGITLQIALGDEPNLAGLYDTI